MDQQNPLARNGPPDLARLLRYADVAEAIIWPIWRRIVAGDGGNGYGVEAKRDGSFVTPVERSAELALRDLAFREAPEDGFLGEEFGEVAGSSGRRITVDPVDGTASFVFGIPTWGILLSLQNADAQGEPRTEIVVLSMSALNRLWFAVAGSGSYAAEWSRAGELDVRRIRVNTADDIRQASATGSGIGGIAQAGLANGVIATRDASKHFRKIGNGWSHALVAEGASAWGSGSDLDSGYDVPVGLLVEEAGGRISIVPTLSTAKGVFMLSSNGVVHERLLEMVHLTGVG